MRKRESVSLALQRQQKLEALQKKYEHFETFLKAVVEDLMGFYCTPPQIDIGRYLEFGPSYKMIQAQRGQAKTTITAAYAVWRIIHDPTLRVLIISAGSPMAGQVSGWIIQIIEFMDELECLRPDRSAGDRESVEGYDIHYSLKGPEKSPSIACLGVTSTMQGYRADLLIADDIESSKNSRTAVQREVLLNLTKDFSSICANGDIIYLGTPQSVDSVYNSLPGRGFDIRIWPGRFPTPKELQNYGTFLAPSILAAITRDPALQTGGGPTGDRGQPVDPQLLSEAALTKKEIDQGKAYFQLQHMLDTRLMDEDRFPLKSDKLVFMTTLQDRAPLLINWSAAEINRLYPPVDFPIKERYYRGNVAEGSEYGPFEGTHMYVDPAGGGQNGDEIAFAVSRFVAGKVHLVDIGGMLGGLNDKNFDTLTDVAVKWKPHQIDVEKNYGNGALASVWTPRLLAKHKCHIEDVWETGQKELRIIDALEPVIGSNRLIVTDELLQLDWERCQKYPAEKRGTYSLFWQLARITRDKGSLVHDDRLDALAGTVRHWIERLARDSDKENLRVRQANFRQLMKNPLGNGRPMPLVRMSDGKLAGPGRVPNRLDKFFRR